MPSGTMRDELEIRRLLAEYCHLCDDGDIDALVDRFTGDGTFAFGGKAHSGGAGSMTGVILTSK